ncbi:MAG: hypothetical protein LUO79_06390 [Methanomassiliicoccales archaeon]|nr:hypothetical protein [Methanomassiliicoccales archaeon]
MGNTSQSKQPPRQKTTWFLLLSLEGFGCLAVFFLTGARDIMILISLFGFLVGCLAVSVLLSVGIAD